MSKTIFLSNDGSWGDSEGLLMFNVESLPEELYERLIDDPEDAYSAIQSWVLSVSAGTEVK